MNSNLRIQFILLRVFFVHRLDENSVKPEAKRSVRSGNLHSAASEDCRWQTVGRVYLASLHDVLPVSNKRLQTCCNLSGFWAAHEEEPWMVKHLASFFHHVVPERPVGFDLDLPMPAAPHHFADKRTQVLAQRFAACNHQQVTARACRFLNQVHDFGHGHKASALGVFRVASRALQVTACQPKKDRWHACQWPFALDGHKAAMNVERAVCVELSFFNRLRIHFVLDGQ